LQLGCEASAAVPTRATFICSRGPRRQ
jgi:hypothetical protein